MDLLDTGQLAALYDLAGPGTGEMVEDFGETSRGTLRELGDLLHAGATAEAADLVHQVKGGAATVGFAALGAVLGARIPAEWGLDFAAAIMFTALFAPMLKRWPHGVAMVTATGVALALHDLPFALGLIFGGITGMAAGAVADALVDPAR